VLHRNKPFFSPHATHAFAISLILPLDSRGTGFSPVISRRAITRRLGSLFTSRRRYGTASRPIDTMRRKAGWAAIFLELDVGPIPHIHSATAFRNASSVHAVSGDLSIGVSAVDMGGCRPFEGRRPYSIERRVLRLLSYLASIVILTPLKP
jgi:hypothetical protein